MHCISDIESTNYSYSVVYSAFQMTASSAFIHVNRPASGGTVPHFHQMSRGPAKSADVPHFSKMVLLLFSLPIILHVCLATQQSDELRIKIGSKFARRQATDYKYTVL